MGRVSEKSDCKCICENARFVLDRKRIFGKDGKEWINAICIVCGTKVIGELVKGDYNGNGNGNYYGKVNEDGVLTY